MVIFLMNLIDFTPFLNTIQNNVHMTTAITVFRPPERAIMNRINPKLKRNLKEFYGSEIKYRKITQENMEV